MTKFDARPMPGDAEFGRARPGADLPTVVVPSDGDRAEGHPLTLPGAVASNGHAPRGSRACTRSAGTSSM